MNFLELLLALSTTMALAFLTRLQAVFLLIVFIVLPIACFGSIALVGETLELARCARDNPKDTHRVFPLKAPSCWRFLSLCGSPTASPKCLIMSDLGGVVVVVYHANPIVVLLLQIVLVTPSAMKHWRRGQAFKELGQRGDLLGRSSIQARE